jgi:hypothetical protein
VSPGRALNSLTIGRGPALTRPLARSPSMARAHVASPGASTASAAGQVKRQVTPEIEAVVIVPIP